MVTTIDQSSTRPHQIIHPSVLAHIFLATSFKVDLNFQGRPLPSGPFRKYPSIEVLRQQIRKEKDLLLLRINKSVAYICRCVKMAFLNKGSAKKIGISYLGNIPKKCHFFLSASLIKLLIDSLLLIHYA